MLKGNIYIVSDPDIVMGLAPTHTIICVSGETHLYPELIKATNANIGSIFLPPYEATASELDGNKQMAVALYCQHLLSKEPRQFFSIILRSLYNGNNIILYLTKDEEQMSYIRTFMEFVRMTYGINIGYQNFPCSFDSSYTPYVLNQMLIFDLLDPMEYLLNMPTLGIDMALSDPEIVTKLAVYFNPYVSEQTLDSYREAIKR